MLTSSRLPAMAQAWEPACPHQGATWATSIRTQGCGHAGGGRAASALLRPALGRHHSAMIRPTLLLPALLLTGCVSEEDVRLQVDQSAATVRQELATVRSEAAARSDKLTADLAAARSESSGRDDKLAADLAAARSASDQRLAGVEQQQKTALTDLAAMRADLQRIAGDLGRTAQELQRRIEASSGVLRDHLQRQRASIADQLKAIDQIISGLDGPAAPAPVAPAAAEPTPLPR